ncbi:hypothetical protein GCM10027048_05620 [Hymenobacter coalescens]
MSIDSVRFLPFWSALYLRPRAFFRGYLVETDRPPYFILAILLYGMGHGVERADKQLTKADLGGRLEQVEWLNHWPSYWTVAVLAGVLGGYLAYLVAGWFYDVRLRWSGARSNLPLARQLYLYSSVVGSAAYVLNALLATFLLPRPYGVEDDFSTTEGVGSAVMLFFMFYSVYVSYCGVVTVTDAAPRKARWWFLILPGALYVMALGVLGWALARA